MSAPRRLLRSFLPFLRRLVRPAGGFMLKKTLPCHADEGKRLFFANGEPLLLGDAPHSRIQQVGRGLCSHWENNLMFSRHQGRLWLPFWPIVQHCSGIGPLPDELFDHALTPVGEDVALPDMIRELTDLPEDPSPGAKPPHLLVLTHGFSSGGAERQWCYLAAELCRRGYRVSVLVFSLAGQNSHYLPLLSGLPLDIYELDSFWGDARQAFSPGLNAGDTRINELVLAIRTLQPTHVLCQLDQTNIYGGAAALAAGDGVRRILLSFRNLNPTHFPHIHEPWMRDSYRALIRSQRVMLSGNSLCGNNDYARWLDIAPERIAFIPNAFVPENFCSVRDRNSVREELGIAQDALVVIGVFRLAEEKNPFLFLDVLCELKKRCPNLMALHLGAGPYAEPLADRAKTLKLQKRVRFLGRRSDVPDLMAAADMLLLCSNQEGTPNVLMEAQYQRLPVVATAVGGTPQTVVEGETAFLAPPGRAAELTAHCHRLAVDPELRARMGAAGREYVLREFSLARLGDRTLRALDLPRFPLQAAGGRLSTKRAVKA